METLEWTLHISHGKASHTVTCAASSLLLQLKERIAETTGVPPANQKLTFKGMRFDKMRDGHAADAMPLAEVGLTDGASIMLIGNRQDVYDKLQDEADKALKREEARKKARRHMNEERRKETERSLAATPRFGFGSLEVLTQYDLDPSIPPSAQARDLLHRLSRDPAILAIMDLHQWNVGVLKELGPSLATGIVGISETCLLGYNQNKGEAIALRLRTDDLQGFRHYRIIIKTLLHELAHMVHSEHDQHFHALNRQLNKEYVSLDWRKSQGRTTGAGVRSEFIADEEEEEPMFEGATQALGGDREAQRHATPAEMARLAALTRLSEEEQLLTDTCGQAHPGLVETSLREQLTQQRSVEVVEEGDVCEMDGQECEHESHQHTHTTGAAASESMDIREDKKSTGRRANEAVVPPMEAPAPFNQEDSKKSKGDDTRGSGIELPLPSASEDSASELRETKVDLSNLIQNEVSAEERARRMEVWRNAALAEASSTKGMNPYVYRPRRSVKVGPEFQAAIPTYEGPPGPDADTIGDRPAVTIYGNGAAGDPDAKITEVTDDEAMAINAAAAATAATTSSSSAHPPAITLPEADEGAAAMDGEISAKVAALRRALHQLVSSCRGSEERVTQALGTLGRILGNIMAHPGEDKYKRIRLAGDRFHATVGSLEGGLEFLKLAGFSQPEGSEFLVYTRGDLGLIWMAKDIVGSVSSSVATS